MNRDDPLIWIKIDINILLSRAFSVVNNLIARGIELVDIKENGESIL